ncbi:MAG: hypothetical protein ABI053_01595, partial [Lacisediminihabitans sp.]
GRRSVGASGDIGLFLLQQTSQRWEAQRVCLGNAAVQIMATFESMGQKMVRGSVTPNVTERVIKTWRFLWLLNKKDEPVSQWVFAKRLYSSGSICS